MTNLLSTISGHLTRSLVIGVLLPVILVTTLFVLLGMPYIPASWNVFERLEVFAPEWRLIAFTFAAIVLTGILHALNVPLIRVYEGYPWRHSWVGALLTSLQLRRWRYLDRRWRGLRTLTYSLQAGRDPDARKVEEADPDARKVEEAWGASGRALQCQYPDRAELVLPTRLGNVIRSFERYPKRQYELLAVTVWPRLVGSIDKDYATGIDSEKALFDFMLNTSFLSAISAASILVAGLLEPAQLWVGQIFVRWLFALLIFFSVALLAYQGAVNRAAAWGEVVKAAFDLYRRDLLKKLGYTQDPETLAEERELWYRISRQLLYGDSLRRPISPFVFHETSATGVPPTANLDVAKGVRTSERDGVRREIVTVRNASKVLVKGLVISDRLPVGAALDLASVAAEGRSVRVTGTNPYRFVVDGDLLPEKDMELTYSVVSTQKAGVA